MAAEFIQRIQNIGQPRTMLKGAERESVSEEPSPSVKMIAQTEPISPKKALGSKTHPQRRYEEVLKGRYCMSCGHKLPKGSLFCNKCGSAQE